MKTHGDMTDDRRVFDKILLRVCFYPSLPLIPKMVKNLQCKIKVSLLDVENLEEAMVEDEIHVDEVETTTMLDEAMMVDPINGAEFVKKIVMKRKIVGIETSHETIIAKKFKHVQKRLGMCKKIIVSVFNKKQHLLKKKIMMGICYLLAIRRLRSERMCGI